VEEGVCGLNWDQSQMPADQHELMPIAAGAGHEAVALADGTALWRVSGVSRSYPFEELMAAEMERDLIRERTLDGLRATEAQGRRGCRPAVVDEDVLAVVRARQAKGESIPAIARHLRIGRSTLYRALAETGLPRPSS
jgi:hypothetical protein